LAQHDSRRPFFLGVGYEIGHLPFCVPKKYWDLYDRDRLSIPGAADQPPWSPDWVRGDKEPAQYYWQHSYDQVWHPTYDQQKELLHGHYAAMSYWDAQIGRLLEALDQYGLRQQTIIVITTDHGFYFGEHEFFGKLCYGKRPDGTTYESGEEASVWAHSPLYEEVEQNQGPREEDQ